MRSEDTHLEQLHPTPFSFSRFNLFLSQPKWTLPPSSSCSNPTPAAQKVVDFSILLLK